VDFPGAQVRQIDAPERYRLECCFGAGEVRTIRVIERMLRL
jgi:hypothetical protein